MSCATPIPTIPCSNQGKAAFFLHHSAAISCPRTSKSLLLASIPRWSFGSFSSWNGLKHLHFSIKHKYHLRERKGKCKGMVVYASLFGVGAPEALVIGVVALLVFGPKGLAEVARNLGKTLRSFQPTIKELQEVSREFKSTLEREIGLDDIPSSTENALNSTPPYVNENKQAKVDPRGPNSATQQQTTTPAVTSEDKPQDGTPPTEAPKISEDFLEVTQGQMTDRGTAEQQEVVMTSEEMPQDGTSPARAPYSSEELLKVTEEQLIAAAAAKEQTSPEKQHQESGAGMPSSEKSESERLS